MKKALLAALFATVSSTSVFAADGKIDFVGEITDTTCNVTTGTNGDFTVTLPTVSTSALDQSGKKAGNTTFTIELSGCSGSATQVAAHFESDSNADQVTGNLIPTTAPANVQIGLADAAGNQAVVGGATSVGYQTINSGAATLTYQAYYFAKNGVTTSGPVQATTYYTLSYQ